jgi:integrase
MRQARDNANEWRAARGREQMKERGTYADHLTPMVLLSINTGMRRGEVFTLLWEDVDLKHKLLTVRGESAKSGKLRHINLNSEAVRVLKAWKTASGGKEALVFPGKDGKPFVDVKKAFHALMDAAKVKDFRWHDMRHHFASRFVMAGGDLNTLRELLGHADIKMVLRYAHLSSEHKAAAVERIAGGAR